MLPFPVVPKRFIVGLLLFVLYVKNLHVQCRFVGVFMCADDTHLLHSSQFFDDSEIDFVTQILSWLNNIFFKVNVKVPTYVVY